jgi:anthranilate 1,2-dioxygenase small subunit
VEGSVKLSDDIRRQIEDLIVDCAHTIDDDRMEEWPGYFTEDGVYRIINRDNYRKGRPVGVMDCSSRAMLEDRILALREANVYEPHCYRHLLSGTRITGQSDGAYDVVTSFTVIRTMQEGDISVFCSGKFVDEVVFADGAPLFRKRVVVTDSNRIDTLIVIPI